MVSGKSERLQNEYTCLQKSELYILYLKIKGTQNGRCFSDKAVS
jgi:hypothetical protein